MAKLQRTKMLWYYDAIIDWMIANPGHPLKECAQHIGRTPTTLSIIINSDMFKAALAQRKADFQTIHDVGIIEKTTRVAHASLDALLSSLETRKDKIPIDSLREITDTTLTRLGYGIQKNAGLSVTVNGQANIFAPVSQQDLEEARMALRQVQENKSRTLNPPPPTLELEATETESGPVDEVEEQRDDPAHLPT